MTTILPPKRVYAKAPVIRQMEEFLKDGEFEFRRYRTDSLRFDYYLLVDTDTAVMLVGEFAGKTMMTVGEEPENLKAAGLLPRYFTRIDLAVALDTANGWSSDQAGNGLALLSLGTTRKIHSEEHRENALKEIDHNIMWNETWTGTPDESNNPKRDIPRLRELRTIVERAVVGEEIMPYGEYNVITEQMYKDGTL